LDPLEASKWVGSMEESPGRDAAVDALLKNIAAADSGGAAAWAETISDAALRESWKSRLNE
jgi:hypothetical protein